MSDSSTEAEEKVDTGLPADTQASEKTEGAPNAESPPAKDDKQPADIASAVRNALDKASKEQSSGSDGGKDSVKSDSAQEADPKGKTEGTQTEGEEADLSDDEIKALNPKTQRRIRKLVQQTKDLTTELQNVKPAAEQLSGIRAFCDDAGLTKEDVNLVFNIARDFKKNPARALETLTPIMNDLMALVGEVLPKDLQERVDRGQITETDALEMSRLRSRQNLTTEQQKADAKRAAENQAKQETQTLANTVGKAVSDWEKRWQGSDPDYRVKHSRVKERIELEITKGILSGSLPKNAKEATEMAERIRKEVDEEFKKILPKKAPVQSVHGVQTSTGSKPVPKTSREAILGAIGRTA